MANKFNSAINSLVVSSGSESAVQNVSSVVNDSEKLYVPDALISNIGGSRSIIYANYFKRVLDLFISISALICLFIPALLVALYMRYENRKFGGSVFFTQRRPGYKGKLFEIYKFKTMTDEKDEFGKLLPDEKRLTKAGKVIRSLSLDEIPQLINVIKGDMSLVGPRPQLEEYLPLYNENQARRHDVRPGITGLAQVKGRNLINWEKRFKYDVFYVDNISFLLDMYIIAQTFVKVLARDGVEYAGSVELAKFTGTKKKSAVESSKNVVVPLNRQIDSEVREHKEEIKKSA